MFFIFVIRLLKGTFEAAIKQIGNYFMNEKTKTKMEKKS